MNDLVQLCIKVKQQNLSKFLSKKEKAHSNKENPHKENNFVEKQTLEPPKNLDKLK